MKVTLIRADVTSLNGRCYPKGVLEQALLKMPREMFGTVGFLEYGEPVTLENAAFRASGFATNERGDVVAEIAVLDTAPGRKLCELIENKIDVVFRAAGTGRLEGAEVREFEITGIAMLPKERDAFNL